MLWKTCLAHGLRKADPLRQPTLRECIIIVKVRKTGKGRKWSHDAKPLVGRLRSPRIGQFGGAWSARVLGHVVLVIVASGLMYWWYLQPHGFPPLHPRWWTNEVLPWCFLFLGIVAFVATRLGCRIPQDCLLWTLPGFVIGRALSDCVFFPIFSSGTWHVRLLIGLFVAVGLFAVTKCRQPRWLATLFLCAGFSTAAFFTWSRTPAPPSTRPMAAQVPPPGDRTTAPAPSDMSHGVEIDVDRATVRTRIGRLVVTVNPLLEFYSSSPAGYSRTRLTEVVMQPRALDEVYRFADLLLMTFRGHIPGWCQVREDGRDNHIEIEAWSRLNEPVYSHLNHYCKLTVRGSPDLSIAYSPCPNVRLAMPWHSLPYWMDHSFACVYPNGRFAILTGRRYEKGPYDVICEAKLPRGDPLSVTVFDQNVPVFRLRVEDWSSQVSTSLSPTAGWGVPVNAIIPFVAPASHGNQLELEFCLASTHIGRGKDMVGHSPGSYRNRLLVQLLSRSHDQKDQSPGPGPGSSHDIAPPTSKPSNPDSIRRSGGSP